MVSFWVYFAYGVREVWGSDLTSLIYMQLSSFPNTTCWRNCLSSLIVLSPLSKIDHRCVDLFLGSLLSMSVFVLVPYHFDYWSFPLLSWANSRRWWGTGRPGMLQSMGSQTVRHDWMTEQQIFADRLNWLLQPKNPEQSGAIGNKFSNYPL